MKYSHTYLTYITFELYMIKFLDPTILTNKINKSINHGPKKMPTKRGQKKTQICIKTQVFFQNLLFGISQSNKLFRTILLHFNRIYIFHFLLLEISIRIF